MTQNHWFAWRVDCVRAWAPPRVANSKSRGGHPNCNAGAGNARPSHEISLSYYVPKCDVQSGFEEPYLSPLERKRKTEAQFAGGRRRGKKTREKGWRSRNHDHKSPGCRYEGTHHNLCREKSSRNDCFPDLHLGLNENLRMRDTCKFCVFGNKINRAWISLGIAG